MSYLEIIREIEEKPKPGLKNLPISPKTEKPASVMVERVADRRPVFWETVTGQILGPATVTHCVNVRESTGGESSWLCIEYSGGWRWIRDNLLRSRLAFEEQSKPEACQCCHSFRFWESIHGAVACATCRPPVQPGLVVRWLNGKR